MEAPESSSFHVMWEDDSQINPYRSSGETFADRARRPRFDPWAYVEPPDIGELMRRQEEAERRRLERERQIPRPSVYPAPEIPEGLLAKLCGQSPTEGRARLEELVTRPPSLEAAAIRDLFRYSARYSADRSPFNAFLESLGITARLGRLKPDAPLPGAEESDALLENAWFALRTQPDEVRAYLANLVSAFEAWKGAPATQNDV